MGGEVQGKVSVVFASLSLLRPQADQAGGQDLADLGAGARQAVIRLGSRALSKSLSPRMGCTEDKRGWLKLAMISDS